MRAMLHADVLGIKKSVHEVEITARYVRPSWPDQAWCQSSKHCLKLAVKHWTMLLRCSRHLCLACDWCESDSSPLCMRFPVVQQLLSQRQMPPSLGIAHVSSGQGEPVCWLWLRLARLHCLIDGPERYLLPCMILSIQQTCSFERHCCRRRHVQ